ncbi:hypothetical protein TSMG0070 [Halocynthia phage JM-2012]|uniref:hypothetical protein n=1 Tax=Halocynthia phage JM-2012 TaxID=1173297 RepID=UPI00025C691A|nr:hypothetical protein TSMG0070 [Halocynthia phage JM-2012]AFI55353.1 hypothetical protein TSMG0070 [Halocynthia phage JM-2012]
MELSLKQIEEQIDVPLKSYWLFVYSKIRSGVWEELFKTHLDKYYPESPNFIEFKADESIEVIRDNFYQIKEGWGEGMYRAIANREVALIDSNWRISKSGDLMLDGIVYLKEVSAIRNSKRTNFPRTIWQKEELSWLSYYEGVLILSQIYQSITIDFELVYQDKEIHKYSIPVKWEILESPDGVNIKHKGRVNKELVINPKLDRTYEGGLSFIIREIMRKSDMTRVDLDSLLDKYAEDPNNLYSFSTKSKPNIKSSILGTMFKWNITWGNFTRSLKVLGYNELSMSINATRAGRVKTESITSTVSMRIS